ncbi:membrane-associated protein, putative [Bodo saltans]|uniref:Membrane-associated protein, putative n=1 Tax=Bodo saltans TaxID=75058 RepID=A0A0S4ILD7_BODSA|nr:membrane-associated protein, putative [Bodo saltans]|eukprot:CUE55314.1 membrane-associated protein, putative [Bodo saltans]
MSALFFSRRGTHMGGFFLSLLILVAFFFNSRQGIFQSLRQFVVQGNDEAARISPFITNTQADERNKREQRHRTTTPLMSSTTTDADDFVFWSGGGVDDMSEGEENERLDHLHRVMLKEWNISTDIGIGDQQDSLARFVVGFFKHLNVTSNTNTDCATRLPPNQQLLCHTWASLNHNNSSLDNASFSSPLFSGIPLHSMCSLFLSCYLWKRGRYSIMLTPESLRNTFNGLVRDDELMNSSQLLLRNLIHGGDNWCEYEWLADRVDTSKDILHAQVNSVDVRSVFQGGEITIQRNLQRTGVRSLNNNSHDSRRWGSWYAAVRDNGDDQFHYMRQLSSIETIAVLHHRATAGKDMQMVVFPRQDDVKKKSQPEEEDEEECRVPAMNVILFTGDSIAHQLFRRLLDVVRHGGGGRGPNNNNGSVKVPYGATGHHRTTNFRHWPTREHSKSRDMILAIYRTYDEFISFESLMPQPVVFGGRRFVRSEESVSAYFEAVAQTRAARYCNNSQHPRDSSTARRKIGNHAYVDEALFYLVFLSDPITARPRTESLAPCIPAQIIHGEFPPINVHHYEAMRDGASRGMTLVHDPPVTPLRALGVRIPMHVVSANVWEWHESPNTYEWLMRMATNCSVVADDHTTSSDSAKVEAAASSSSSIGGDWRYGHHPSSDATHLYRVETLLWFPRHAATLHRHCPKNGLAAHTDDGRRRMLGQPRELVRLETPFTWLRDAVTKRHRQDIHNNASLSGPNAASDNLRGKGVFFRADSQELYPFHKNRCPLRDVELLPDVLATLPGVTEHPRRHMPLCLVRNDVALRRRANCWFQNLYCRSDLEWGCNESLAYVEVKLSLVLTLPRPTLLTLNGLLLDIVSEERKGTSPSSVHDTSTSH